LVEELEDGCLLALLSYPGLSGLKNLAWVITDERSHEAPSCD
jgi:hypothetical protein